MRMVASAARHVLHWLYPKACLLCGTLEEELLQFRHGVCNICYSGLAEDPHSTCPYCAQTIGPHTNTRDGCPECRRLSLGFDAAFRLGPYTGKLREAVLRMKQLGGEGLADNMGRLFVEQLGEAFPRAELDVVVPVPLHWWRKWSRGYNQAEAIAREMASCMNVRFAPKLLRRIRWTPQQLQSSREARQQNVKGAFRVRRGAKITGLTVLLVDDVMTTGSTLGEASRMLRGAGAEKVIVAILARK